MPEMATQHQHRSMMASLTTAQASFGDLTTLLDTASQVTPKSCVGVVYTGEHEVYAVAGSPELKTQTFGHLYSGADGPHLVQQTAAIFASADDARAFLGSSQAQWNTCARGEVGASLGYENGADYTLGSVQRQGDVIAVSMATNGGENGPDACQQALGVRQNVVVEARTCETPKVTTAFDPAVGWPKDPEWAVPDAERIATAMLDNVKT
ncbi:sensor domain-containing protein [Mycolicibacterium sp. P9-64]|uniref:sensor domain-containing protein n=1 Tax=Mycolicibacterium sp. P9-64 TaxID=2024612 RepID=UPI001F5B0ED5|nr:sensor domain-containing protein [Mycolicibacterium sp. P9-64]